MELKMNDLEQVSGGTASETNDVVAYCKKCGSKLKYLGQTRIEGGNTGQFQCENMDYNGTGKNCPEYHVIKTNTEVNIS